MAAQKMPMMARGLVQGKPAVPPLTGFAFGSAGLKSYLDSRFAKRPPRQRRAETPLLAPFGLRAELDTQSILQSRRG